MMMTMMAMTITTTGPTRPLGLRIVPRRPLGVLILPSKAVVCTIAVAVAVIVTAAGVAAVFAGVDMLAQLACAVASALLAASNSWLAKLLAPSPPCIRLWRAQRWSPWLAGTAG